MLKLVSITACLCLAAAAPAAAQVATTTWQHVLDMNGPRGEIGNLELAPNGDIVVAGFIPKPGSGTGRAQADAWVARYASDGRQIWSRTLGGPIRDQALDLKIAPDGAIFVSGWRDVESPGNWYAFAVRLSADGVIEWETTLRDAWRNTIASEILPTKDGGAVIAGEEKRGQEPGSWPLVVRLDKSGQVEWRANPTPQPDPNAPPLPWGKMEGVAYDHIVGKLGRVTDETVEVYSLAGYFPDVRTVTCLAVSLADGSDTGTKCSGANDFASKKSGSYIGGSTTIYGLSDVRVIKIGHDRSELWRREPKTAVGDGINAVAETPDGGVVAAGYELDSDQVERNNWNGLLVRYDADGKELWRRKFGGSRRDEFKDVAVLPDGSITVAGYTGSQPGPEEWAPWVLRLNPQGELEGDALKQLNARQF